MLLTTKVCVRCSSLGKAALSMPLRPDVRDCCTDENYEGGKIRLGIVCDMRAGFPKRNSCDNRSFRIVPVENLGRNCQSGVHAYCYETVTLQIVCHATGPTCSQWQVLTERRSIAALKASRSAFPCPTGASTQRGCWSAGSRSRWARCAGCWSDSLPAHRRRASRAVG